MEKMMIRPRKNQAVNLEFLEAALIAHEGRAPEAVDFSSRSELLTKVPERDDRKVTLGHGLPLGARGNRFRMGRR